MRINPWSRAILVAVLASVSAVRAEEAEDPAAAEREYALAQRLGADGSPEAAAAFAKVVALAPAGPLADDALVDLARLQGAPDWPEALGALDPARAVQARKSLVAAVDSYPGGDRALEARYRLALIRLAPIEGRDAVRARQELIALAGTSSREPWVAAARYALGVLDEQAGAPERAAGRFARIVVERPDSEIAARARAGFGRTLLAEGRYDAAAGWFQQAVEGGAPPIVRAEALRHLALDEVLRGRVPARRWSALTSKLPVVATTRGANLLATAGDGRMIVFDRKNGVLQAFDTQGVGAPATALADVTALASDPYGRIFAATREQILRWDATGPVVVASLASFGSPSAIAVDAAGSIWIADRKGDRIGRWTPGSGQPNVVRESKGSAVSALVAVGSGVIAAEQKSGRLVAVTESGSERAFGAAAFRRPAALAVDAAGRISVLDDKAGSVTRLAPTGEVQDTLALEAGGVSRPLALACAPDGALRILDGSNGVVAVAP